MSVNTIVKRSHLASLVKYPVNPVLDIVMAAQVCRQSQIPEPRQQQFVRNLIERGHETPLEFVDFTFRLLTTRDVSHQLVRHRLASYQQESQRHVSYSDCLEVIAPVNITDPKMEAVWLGAMSDAQKTYAALIEMGAKKEDARTVLPGATATRLFARMNLRELRHFLKLRLSLQAWSEMRRLATEMARCLFDVYNCADTLLYGIVTESDL